MHEQGTQPKTLLNYTAQPPAPPNHRTQSVATPKCRTRPVAPLENQPTAESNGENIQCPTWLRSTASRSISCRAQLAVPPNHRGQSVALYNVNHWQKTPPAHTDWWADWWRSFPAKVNCKDWMKWLFFQMHRHTPVQGQMIEDNQETWHQLRETNEALIMYTK